MTLPPTPTSTRCSVASEYSPAHVGKQRLRRIDPRAPMVGRRMVSA